MPRVMTGGCFIHPINIGNRTGKVKSSKVFLQKARTLQASVMLNDVYIGSHLLGLGNRMDKSGLRMKYSSATLLTVGIFFSRRGRTSR